MPRKVVKCYIPVEIKPTLEKISSKLGLDESEILRIAFLEYASKYSLITDILKAP